MDFFSKLFGSKKTPEPTSSEPDEVELRGNGSFALEVVGESHYQENLEKICGQRKENGENLVTDATLILENNNPYDKQAVRVEISGLHVGYLSREVARLYREQIRLGGHPRAIGTCKARIKGGWERKNGDKGHYGVWLDIPVSVE
jgi:hypothetical protein